MAEIKIKAHNQQYYIYCSYQSFHDFLKALEEKLQACTRGLTKMFEAIFCFDQPMKEQEIIQLFQYVNSKGALIKGLQLPKDTSPMRIIEEPLYSGQTYRFDQEVLILGSIPADTFVTSKESIYVIGDVSGNVDLLHEDCFLCASYFQQANIRICDSPYQNMTSFSPMKLYYKEAKVMKKEYKEERVWDK
ncbi:MAG: hypothetical protein K2F55_02570 [Erysipelotrichaceae bacterium]|nr:hypothetical protein [Erysipelotrichaceae bacterium]